MSNFYYDQLVTADNLNKIASDLGKTDFAEFADGVAYPVSDLNKITAALCGKGITSDLGKFKIIVSDSGVTVGTGTAIFTSGRKITVSAPIVLPFMAGELFLEEDQGADTVKLKLGTLPETNDYIHLATINEDHTYTVKTVLAKALTGLPARSNSYMKTIAIPQMGTNFSEYRFTVNTKGISKIFIVFDNDSGLPIMLMYDTAKHLFYGINSNTWGQPKVEDLFTSGSDWFLLDCDINYGRQRLYFYSEKNCITEFRVQLYNENDGYWESTNKLHFYAWGGVKHE